MVLTPTEPRSAPATIAAPIQQVYVTHCLYDEGLQRKAGFGIRACSTSDPLLLRFCSEYPDYQTPSDLPNGELSPATAPRRLALVRMPGGRCAVIHSVHVPEQDRGRLNNYFTHVLVPQTTRAWRVLASWGSTDWVTHYPPEGDKNLPGLAELPRGERVNDEAVTAFLQPEVSNAGETLATLTCPPRLAEEAQKRRELVAWMLRGCQLVLQNGLTAPRTRLYIRAEPGLTALLLYAAARLLPEALALNLTFSTYEDAHRTLRLYRHAQIIGTYTADPNKDLDEEFFTRRGYALDTFSHRVSLELQAATEPVLDEWIDLAGQGDWSSIDKVHSLLGRNNTSVVSFKEGLRAAKLSRRLATGQAQAQDLLELKRSRLGEPILEQQPERLWQAVREASFSEPQLVKEFADLFRQHLPELEQQASQAVKFQSPEGWQPPARLLWSVLKSDPAKLGDAFVRVLPEPPYSPEQRFALLRELRDLPLSPADQKLPLHMLVRDVTTEELEQIARSDLPREWYVWALCYAVVRPETREVAVKHLHGCDDPLFLTFWDQFGHLKDETQRRAILAPLVATDEPARKLCFSRLLRNRCSLRPDTMEWLLQVLGAGRREWTEFWSRDDHLGCLIDIIREYGDEATAIWARLCGKINQDVLFSGHSFQQTLLLNLAAAKDRPGPTLPADVAQTIADWVLLRDHFEKASALPLAERQPILDACNRRGVDPIRILAAYFRRFIQPRGVNPAVLDDFAGFFHSFYLECATHQEFSSRLIGWLQVVEDSLVDERGAFQLYYLERWIPLEFRWQLAAEIFAAGKLQPAAFEAIPRLTEPGSPGSFNPSAPSDPLFSWTGVRLPESDPAALQAVSKRIPWLACALVGGLLAAVVSGLYKVKPPHMAAMALFVPVLLALVDSVTLQALGLTLFRSQRRMMLRGEDLLRRIGRELLIGLILGVAAAALMGLVVMLWIGHLWLAMCLAVALAGGMAAAAGVGFCVPASLRLLGFESRVAAAPIARAVSLVVAVWIYFTLARLLLG
jgi:hypothetical protein